MPSDRKPQDSPLRRAQAAATRHKIVDAAASLFATQGYDGARIDDVAAVAGVAYPTVYKAFGNKRSLLQAAVDLRMTGGTDGDIARQDWFREQLEAPTAEHQLRLVARNARRLYDRAGRLLETVRATAARDDEIAALWRAVHDDRLTRAHETAERLATKAELRGTESHAVHTLWTLTVPELYVLQTETIGLDPDDYERWLADMLVAALLRR
jgi:AcrR family transcriptional regulator